MGVSSSLATDRGTPSVLCYMGFSIGQLNFPQSKPAREQERASKMDVTIIYKLISEVSSYHFCRIPFVKSESPLGLAHTQGKGLYSRQESLEAILESAVRLPQCPLSRNPVPTP